MLKTRVITAVALLAVLLPALFAASALPFSLLTLLLIGAAGWEWARLAGVAGGLAVLFGAMLAAAGGAALVATSEGMNVPSELWWIAVMLWVLGGRWALRLGPSGWPTVGRTTRLVLGAGLLLLAWLAMVEARQVGLNFLLSIFCLVWAADVAAYFGGRAFGRRKLAPAISPGKSWEGVWAGMLGVLVLAAAWAYGIDAHWPLDSASLYSRLLFGLPLPVGVLALLFLTVMSVVGDLFESLVKRAAGAKDSSGLLPGHGGVLDRVDALLPVFPLALALSSLSVPR